MAYADDGGMTVRIFAGLSFEPDAMKALAEVADKAKQIFPGRYTMPENYHCTLKFIGQVEDEQIYDIKAALENAAADAMPFSVTLDKLSYFRRCQDAILFCGLRSCPPLADLAERTGQELVKAGFSMDNSPFHPHVTLARQARIVPERLLGLPVASASSLVQQIILYESCRVQDQLRYVPIFICPFRK